MKNTDVLIIGGSAAGMVAAITGKSHWPEKSFTLVKKQKDMMVPCGIPYIFGTLGSTEKNLMPVDTMMEKNGITSMLDEAVDINTTDKVVTFASGEKVGYGKLVIATGSTPMKPKWLKGADLDNVFVVPKDRYYLDDMKQQLGLAKKIAVIGAGFIGVEFSDELAKQGYEVTLIEKEPHILSLAFDPEIAEKIHEMLVARGVHVKVGKGISSVLGQKKVEAIEFDDGTKMDMDAVILSMGYKPNNELAKKSGITLDEDGFIIVDE